MINSYGTSSGQQVSTGQVSIMRGALLGIDLTPPSSGYATLLIYDSENSDLTTKKIISEIVVDAGYLGLNHEYMVPLGVDRGLYCVLSYSSGSSADSHYYVRYLLG